jgi:predicted phosphoribosyltransferase
MIFKDRIDAANKLKQPLEKYKNKDVIILALLKGGIIIADILAKYLNTKLDILICKKITMDEYPQLAIGSICLNEIFINNDIKVEKNKLDLAIKKALDEYKKKEKLYSFFKKTNIRNKIVIIVDDGIATGSTVLSAIQALKNKTKEIIIATPIASNLATNKIKPLVDGYICLDIPDDFFSVSQFYENFDQIDDEKVLEILKNQI